LYEIGFRRESISHELTPPAKAQPVDPTQSSDDEAGLIGN